MLSNITFETIATIAGLIGDAAVLVLTIYTLHITAWSRKVELLSPSFHTDLYHGNKMGVSVLNKTLRAIPVQRIFVIKRFEKKYYLITLAKYEDPEVIEAGNIRKFISDPYTKIIGMKWEDTETTKDAVYGIKSGNKTLWMKPYKKAPLWRARRAYRKYRCIELTTHCQIINDVVISECVDWCITLVAVDINDQKRIETIFGVEGAEGLILDKTICGHNMISGCDMTEAGIKKAIVQMGIEEVSVQKIDKGILKVLEGE